MEGCKKVKKKNILFNKQLSNGINQKYIINNNFIKKNKMNLIKTITLNILIIINCFNIVLSHPSTSAYRKLQTVQKIKLKVLSSGDQEIISSDYTTNLQVYIDDQLTSIDTNNKINIPDNNNIITLQWSNSLSNCDNMFSGLSNIVEIDLTDFDTTEVTSMQSFFEDCVNLQKITFSENYIISIDSTKNFFSNCNSLTSLDLSCFDTSEVTIMDNMF